MYFTSNLDYAMKYSKDKVFVLSLLILGNSFPVIEHPFEIDEDGNIIQEPHQNQNKLNPLGYYGKSLRPGYQSHFSLGSFHFHFHFVFTLFFFSKKSNSF